MDKFEFEKWIERILKIMKECESYIGMTLAEAIEKQIPKAPVWSEEGKWVCPVCGNIVYKSYCDYCGQRLGWEAVLDWEEDDNGDK